MRRISILVVAAIACLSLGLLSACAGTGVNSQNPDRYNVLNKAHDYDKHVKEHGSIRIYSDEDVAAARDGLIAAGVFSESELSDLSLDKSASRAQFISYMMRAAGVPVPANDTGIASTTWYAPYVNAAYNANAFPNSGLDLSFLPTDGFFLGDKGWEPMLEDVILDDVDKTLTHMYAGENPVPELTSKEHAPYGDYSLSQADMLVCAWRAHQKEFSPATSAPTALPISDLLAKGRVVHAGGKIEDANGKKQSYTSSVEALMNAYKGGARLVELDFTQTPDNHLACIHGWSSKYSSDITDDQALNLPDWLNAKIYGSLSPLCLESVASFMRQHPDLYILTDVKSDNNAALQLIAQTCPDLKDRFVVQIYNEKQYDTAASLGFPNIVYTIYNISRADKLNTGHLVEFAKTHPLTALTFPSAMLDEEGYVEALLEAGTPLCVHTINKDDKMANAYSMGITAIYTDNVQ